MNVLAIVESFIVRHPAMILLIGAAIVAVVLLAPRDRLYRLFIAE